MNTLDTLKKLLDLGFAVKVMTVPVSNDWLETKSENLYVWTLLTPKHYVPTRDQIKSFDYKTDINEAVEHMKETIINKFPHLRMQFENL